MEAVGGCCYSAMSDAWKLALPQWLLLWTMILGAASLRLTITPDHLDGGVSGATFRVLCLSSEPLSRCQFRWRDVYDNEGPLMDLSEGPDTPVATNYSYSGTGLDKGQCGISLNRPTGVQRWVVGCRVRAATSGWHYAQMTLYAHLKGATSVYQSPRVVTVPPGGNATLSCRSTDPLIGCVFRLPDGSSASFLPGNRSLSPSYRFAGVGPGGCAIAISPVTEAFNGFAWCRAWRGGYDEWRAFALVVTTPPSVPVLSVSSPDYAVGDVLRATCSVSDALPDANMTWYLGDDIVRRDDANEARVESWRWPFQRQAIVQTFTRRLEAGDGGKTLACVVRQGEGEEGVRALYTIDFHTVPTVELTVSRNDFKEGETLSATCTLVGVYPLAEVAWYLGPDDLATGPAGPNRTVVASGPGGPKSYVLVETVTKALVGEDDGKEVVCVVGRPGLTQSIRRAAIVGVRHSPQISQQPREQLKFKVGSPGVAVVEFRANPRPSVYWTFNQTTVKEGYTDITGRFQAAFMTKNANDPSAWAAKLFISNVTLEDLRTFFFLNARNELGEEFFRAVNFNTTEPAVVSAQPTLTLGPSADYFAVGATIKATCTVTSSRPVATITWTLSNFTITEGVSQPMLSQSTPGGKYTVVQGLTLRVQEKDDGSQLACSAGMRRTSLDISVMYPPKEFVPIIEQYGFEVGKPGVISIEISANPQPTAKWEIGGITVEGSEFDSSKPYHAVPPLAKRRGVWVAKLVVVKVSREDMAAVIKLTAVNRAGSTAYSVRLSPGRRPVKASTTGETSPSPTSTVFEDVATETDWDVPSTSVKPILAVPVKSPEATYVIRRNDSSYRYLGIANTIAILTMVLVATVLYIRLLRRLSRASGGFDMDRAPIYMDNMYYDQMHGSGGQCNPAANQQDALGCECV